MSKPFNCTSFIIHEKIGKHIQKMDVLFCIQKNKSKGVFKHERKTNKQRI
ncbi:hypothetical protein BAT_0037 [Bacillus pumilus ATCC 7061]|nr:hypothetical protein BAT_0037 [Bacillus pumilus ATCC 7061]